MNLLNLIVIICVVSVISLLLKKCAPEYSLLLNIIISIIVCLYLFPNIINIINQIKNLINISNISDKYILILFKTLGICFIVQFASDTCTDSGEISLASKIEIIGKIIILTISMPLFNEIAQTAINLTGVH